MPYNPGIVDRSGELLAQGISQAGGAIGGAIGQIAEDQRKARDERDFIRAQLEMMAQTAPGVVTQEMLAKAENGSLGAAKGIFTQAAMSLQRFMDRADEDRKMALQKDLAAFRAGLETAAQAGGDAITFQEAPGGQTIAVNKRGTFTVLPEPELPEGPPAVDLLPLPGTSYAVPFANGRPMGTVPLQMPEETGPPVGAMSLEQRYRQVEMQDGSVITFDTLTGQPVPSSQMRPPPKPTAEDEDALFEGLLPRLGAPMGAGGDPLEALRNSYLK